MSVKFKKLTQEDLPTFIQMRMEQLQEEGAEPEIDLTQPLLDYYKKHMGDQTFFSYLAVDGDKIVGTSGMSVIEKPPYYSNPSGKIGLLSSMYTMSEYRRKGISGELLKRVMEDAKKAGCGVVQITASDMGVLLYTNYGFRKNGNFMQYVF